MARDKQLDGKIQNRLKRLGISRFEIPELKDGCSYLKEILYVMLSDDSIDDISEAFEKVSRKKRIPLYELRTDVESVIGVIDVEVLKSFYKSEKYNLKFTYDIIQLIADDILMD